MNSPSPASVLFPSDAPFSAFPASPSFPSLDPSSPLSLLRPLSFDSPASAGVFPANDLGQQEPIPPPRKHRGRKEQSHEQKQQARLRRSERNRQYARENRERKKQQIGQLELRVQSLSAELWACRKRLAEYESAAASGSLQEFCDRVKRVTQQLAGRLIMQVANVLENVAPRSVFDAMPVMQNAVGERTRAMDLMAQAMIELSIPAPCRYMIRIAEGMDAKRKKAHEDNDMLNANTILRSSIDDRMREESERFLGSVPEVRKALRENAAQLRRSVNQYFVSLENIKQKAREMDLYMVEHMAPMLDEGYLRNLVVWTRACICGGNDVFVPRPIMPAVCEKNDDVGKKKDNYC